MSGTRRCGSGNAVGRRVRRAITNRALLFHHSRFAQLYEPDGASEERILRVLSLLLPIRTARESLQVMAVGGTAIGARCTRRSSAKSLSPAGSPRDPVEPSRSRRGVNRSVRRRRLDGSRSLAKATPLGNIGEEVGDFDSVEGLSIEERRSQGSSRAEPRLMRGVRVSLR